MKHLNETLNLLYKLEIYLEYDKTKLGIEIGTLINKLQKELMDKQETKDFNCKYYNVLCTTKDMFTEFENFEGLIINTLDNIELTNEQKIQIIKDNL
jgi:hypothetical protein|tara:strand:- start:2086 stop:2376 length:291 start_codon:yes stop_codon:yes gene_type:complete